jgi:hypothetical protein
MVSSKATSVDAYLRELGDEERMDWGMIAWEVPMSVSGPTYNKKPLVVAALAAQKNYYAVYLPVSMDPLMEKEFRASYRKKLDMGKSCLRFKAISEVDLEAVKAALASMPVERYLQLHRNVRPPKS